MKGSAKRRRGLILIGVLFLGCAGHTPLPAVGTLARSVNDADAANLSENAPVAWAEAQRYLVLATRMDEQGEPEQAERFAVLGTIQLKIARSRADQAALKKRFVESKTKRAALESEIEAIRAETGRLEARIERKRVREHLLAVVEENRLQAAAVEEKEERKLTRSEKKALASARHRVGYEMIARADIWGAIAHIIEEVSTGEGEDGPALGGSLEMAREALKQPNLAAVQQAIEVGVVRAFDIIDGAWEKAGGVPDDVMVGVLSQLAREGFETVVEEFGSVWKIPINASSPVEVDMEPSWAGSVRRLGQVLAPVDSVHCLVIGSSRWSGSLTREERESLEIAARVKDLLVASGIPLDRVVEKGTGPASPMASLKEEGLSAVVLLVPVPRLK